MKGDTVRKNAKKMMQSTVKVPTEIIKLQQDVELTIAIFFINKHTFFSTYSTKICFTTVTHLILQTKSIDMGITTPKVQDVPSMWLLHYCD